MALAAATPDVAEVTACGRAVVMPVAGSAFPGGHNPRVGFLRAVQLEASAPACREEPFVLVDVAEIVEVVEDAVDAMDELEFWRCAVFRGPGVNILLISSAFMLLLLHPRFVEG